MERSRAALAIRAFALLGALATASCGAHTAMTAAPAGAQPPTGTPGVATVVFLRPSSFAFSVKFRIIDHTGHFVGDAVTSSYFVVRTKPGESVFILGDDDIDVLYANLAPGLVYYVDVVPVAGSFAPRAVFQPVKPGDPEWVQVERQLESKDPLVPDVARGQAELDHDPLLQNRIERAKKMWADLPPDERARRFLGPADGAGIPSNASFGAPAPLP